MTCVCSLKAKNNNNNAVVSLLKNDTESDSSDRRYDFRRSTVFVELLFEVWLVSVRLVFARSS